MIVSDADNALALTIRNLFGDAVEHRQCEWHLGRKLRYHLPDQVLADRTHPITVALGDAFHSLERWDPLEMRSGRAPSGEHGPLRLAIKWLDTYGQLARAQIPTRDPRGPNSTGPVEQILREIDRRIGDRVGLFTNRPRLAKLLDLMTLDLLGKADGRDWADRLKNASTSPLRPPHQPATTRRSQGRPLADPLTAKTHPSEIE